MLKPKIKHETDGAILLNKTRGPWATTLTWENFLKIDKHVWLLQCRFREEKTHYLLYENWMVLHLNKLESPSPKDALWHVWLKLVQWFLGRFLNFKNVFLLFRYYLPLEKGGALHLNKLEPPSAKDALCQVRLKLVQWFLRRIIFLKFRQCIFGIA